MSDGADTTIAAPRTAKPALPPVVSFALAAVLIVVGAIALWQAWPVWQVERGADYADEVRTATVAAIAKQVQGDQQLIAHALEDASVQQALQQDDGHAAAAVALKRLLPAATDAKAFARLGIRTFGFAPLRLPPELDFSALFHGVDERVPVDALQFGVRVLERLLLDG